MSLSTVIALKVVSFNSDTSACRSGWVIFASVKRYTSMVAISGAIIPEPLAMPVILTVPSEVCTLQCAPLGKVSVVMIACAASAIFSACKPATKAGNWAVIRPWGNGSPITPVEDENTRSSGTESSAATAQMMASTASSPLFPVNALAFPEFTMIAAPLSQDVLPILLWQSSTGAARVFDWVNTPATAVPTASSASMTSSRPWYFTPAALLAKRTPPTAGSLGNTLGASGDHVSPAAITQTSALIVRSHQYRCFRSVSG